MNFYNISHNYKNYFSLILYLIFIPVFFNLESLSLLQFLISNFIMLIMCFVFFYINFLLNKFSIIKIVFSLSFIQGLLIITLFAPSASILLFIFLFIAVIYILIHVKLFSKLMVDNGKLNICIKSILIVLIFALIFGFVQLEFKDSITEINFSGEGSLWFIYSIIHNLFLLNLMLLLFKWVGFEFVEIGLYYELDFKKIIKSLLLILMGLTFCIIINKGLTGSYFDSNYVFIRKYREMIWVFIEAGFQEEFLFRGVLLLMIRKYLEKKKFSDKKILSILIVNFIFVLFHFNSPAFSYPSFWIKLFIDGMIFSIIRVFDDNIIVPSIIHTLLNTLN